MDVLTKKSSNNIKVRKRAKIRNQYNQVPHLTQCIYRDKKHHIQESQEPSSLVPAGHFFFPLCELRLIYFFLDSSYFNRQTLSGRGHKFSELFSVLETLYLEDQIMLGELATSGELK